MCCCSHYLFGCVFLLVHTITRLKNLKKKKQLLIDVDFCFLNMRSLNLFIKKKLTNKKIYTFIFFVVILIMFEEKILKIYIFGGKILRLKMVCVNDSLRYLNGFYVNII